jgi:hypothetical protein
MNMATSLYYTFSTIAQSLAGAIGLLGAFVLFNLQSINEEIERYASQIATVLSLGASDDEPKKMLRDRRYHELLERLSTTVLAPSTYQCDDERVRLPLLLYKRDTLVSHFKLALYLTVAVIFTSVIVLIFAEAIASIAAVEYFVFAVGVIGLARCLAAYVSLMRTAIG